MKAKWKDTTGYSQGDKERKPKTWSTEISGLRITVTCGHIYHSPRWVMHCFQVGLDTQPIPGESELDAQKYAIEMVKCRLRKWSQDFEGIEP